MYLIERKIILLTYIYFVSVLGIQGLGIGHSFFLNTSNYSPLLEQVVNHTIVQPLDHFDKNEKRTWQMLYYERTDLWKKGGPIYLFVGGEESVSRYVFREGLMYELAKETNGVIFASQHRYYGDPKPLPGFNAENLAFLSSRQALADLAELLKFKKSLPQYKESKVVLVGGSYSGNLATWMRLLYPELVDAVIASSAPVLAKKDYYEYLEILGDDFKQNGGQECYDQISSKFSRYDHLFQTSAGVEQLKKEENICNYTDMTKVENKQTFFLGKIDFYALIAEVVPWKISQVCNTSGDMNQLQYSILKRNSFVKPVFLNEDDQCLNYDLDNIIEYWKKDKYQVPWLYQSCTEFGLFMTSSSNKHPFRNNVPIDLYINICSKLFGPDFNEQKVNEGVKKINDMYGGLKPKVTKVVFINGDLDPWHRLGILENLSADAPAKLVHGTSQCADLFKRDNEPEEMTKTREYVKKLIKKWINLDKN